MGLGHLTFTAGQKLTAAQVNGYLMKQANMVFASASARSTALGAIEEEGMVSFLSDKDRAEFWNGSAWKILAGRCGGRWERVATQSVTGSALTTISWDTETDDTDGFLAVPGSDITIPAGLAGFYVVTAQVVGSTNWTASGSILRINAASVNYDFAAPTGNTRIGATAMAFLGVGQIIQAVVYNADATKTVTGRIQVIYVAA